MRLSKNNVDRFFDYELQLETRTIYLGGEVDDGTTERAIKSLHVLDNGRSGTINILLNTPGGNLYNGMAIYDMILACKNKVIIRVLGQAMSMGSIILQAANERIVHSNATIMIHDGTDYFEGKPRDLESWASHGRGVRKRIYEIYATKSGKSTKYWEKKCINDFILSAQETVREGLADKISGKVK